MIHVKNIAFSYGEKAVLQDFSAHFPGNCLTGIVGPNGCGKTTLLRLLARLTTPQTGELTLEKKPFSDYAPKAFARQVSLLPQEHSAPPVTVCTLAEYGRYPHLAFGRGLGEADHQAVAQALEQTGVAHLAERRVDSLSGGQRQRAFLAMALAQQAQMLLLDEPATFLDPAGQFGLMDLLVRLAREGRCVIAVLHDLPLALRFCDQLLVMEQAAPPVCGKPDDLARQGTLDRVFGIRCRQSEDGWILLPGKN